MHYLAATFSTVSGAGGSSQPLSEVIAERLTEAYLRSGRRQQDIGDEAGLSQSAVSRYLRGARAPDIDTLEALCVALGLDVGDVVTTALPVGRGR